jgi:hypothetical protein
MNPMDTNKQDPWAIQSNASLEQRYEQLHRTTQAMWTLLKSRLELSDDNLRALVATEPAATKPQLIECSVCRNPLQSTARCCLYCGTAPTKKVNTPELRATLSAVRHRAQ